MTSINALRGLKVGILSRKSKPDEPENLSETAQRTTGRGWAAQVGCPVVWCDGDNLPASGITREVDLPKRQECFDLFDAGEIQIIWVARQDRITREGVEEMMRLLKAGYRFWIHDKSLDTATLPDPNEDFIGCLAFLLDADQARKYARNLSANVRTAKATMRDLGAWLAKAPYGTVVVGKKLERRLVPDPETWPVVVRIYTEAAEGKSRRAIAAGLYKDGIPSPSGNDAWNVASVASVLNSPVYEGWQVVRINNHTRIPYVGPNGKRLRVFAEGAETIPAKLAREARKTTRILPLAEDNSPGAAGHLLTGKVRCSGCRASMPVSGTSHTCGTKHAGKPCPAPANAHRARLEEYVADQWLSRMLNAAEDDPVIVEAYKRWKALQAPDEAQDIQEAKDRLAAAEKALQRLMQDRQAGLYDGPTADMFPRLHADARLEWERASAAVKALEPDTGPVDYATAVIHAYTAPEADKRALLRSAVREIYVDKAPRQGSRWNPTERVHIRWVGQPDE